MSKEACYLEIMNRIEILFTPTKEELNFLNLPGDMQYGSSP